MIGIGQKRKSNFTFCNRMEDKPNDSAMTAPPPQYVVLRDAGATATEVYARAFHDGMPRHLCLLLIAGLFDLEIHEARDIGHTHYSAS